MKKPLSTLTRTHSADCPECNIEKRTTSVNPLEVSDKIAIERDVFLNLIAAAEGMRCWMATQAPSTDYANRVRLAANDALMDAVSANCVAGMVNCPVCHLPVYKDEKIVGFSAGKLSPIHHISLTVRAEWCSGACRNTAVTYVTTKEAR